MSSLHARLQILHDVPRPPLHAERVLGDGGTHTHSVPGAESLRGTRPGSVPCREDEKMRRSWGRALCGLEGPRLQS